ncbi:unnamed protein product [Prorocentrum cordatum]|uniref:Uncharacterized protein n=1 Tax=Prorocentrum cordatum TaxID=2364126 RepID=A0ABN9V573_9DINO|nr:unnamed protein product [Polarella glacialis]
MLGPWIMDWPASQKEAGPRRKKFGENAMQQAQPHASRVPGRGCVIARGRPEAAADRMQNNNVGSSAPVPNVRKPRAPRATPSEEALADTGSGACRSLGRPGGRKDEVGEESGGTGQKRGQTRAARLPYADVHQSAEALMSEALLERSALQSTVVRPRPRSGWPEKNENANLQRPRTEDLLPRRAASAPRGRKGGQLARDQIATTGPSSGTSQRRSAARPPAW